MAIVSRLQIDHPALDDPGGAPLHTQVENNFIKIGDNLSARYFEGIAVGNGATVIFDHNFKMPFDELAFKVYLLAGAGGELTVTTESDYDIVATPGNLTTQISVTNNSGGVSTFAVLIQSIGGAGGGGGQTLYDVIIDAAGNGDYVDFKTAIETEPVDTTFYIRNGAYAETVLTQMKEGQKVYGESRDGVVLSFNIAASPAIRAPRTSSGFSRGRTRRTVDNGAWDTVNGLGLLTVVQGSATATYSGNTDPSPTDICLIGPSGDQFEIDVVDGGLNTVTLDAVWKGPSGPTDWIVNRVASTTGWKDQVHGLFNLTIRTTNATGRGIELATTLNFVLKDVAMFSVSTSANDPMFDAKTVSARVTLENVDFISEHLTLTTAAIRMASGASHFKFKNCKMVGCSANSINGQITDPMVYNDFHFSSISQASGGECFINTDFCAYSSFKVDRLTSVSSIFDSSPSASFAEWFDCDFEFGLIDDLHGVLHIGSARSRFSIKKGYQQYTQILINVPALRTDENTNVLHDSWLQNSIRFTAASNHLIIASSVIYGGIFDANEPVWNTGWDHTSPPSLGGGGQTLYDAVVDAAGGADYVSIVTACVTESVGATIFIRRGSYSEDPIVLKLGQKLIGESRDGVIITTNSGSESIAMPQIAVTAVAASTRTSSNLTWDAASGAGLLNMTFESNQAVYTIATDPFLIGDMLIIGPTGEMHEVTAVDSGTNTLTLDRLWKGSTSTIDFVFFRTPNHANWQTLQTKVSDLTIINNISVSRGIVFINSINCEVSRVTIEANGAGTNTRAALFFQSAFNNKVSDVTVNLKTTSSTAGWSGITNNTSAGLGWGNNTLKGIELFGTEENKIGGQSPSPAKYNNVNITRAYGTDQRWLGSWDYTYRSTLSVDWLGGCTGGVKSFASERAELYSCVVTFGHIDESVGAGILRLRGAKCIVQINYHGTGEVSMAYGTAIAPFTNDLGNIISNSYIDGTLTILNSSLIVSSSVMYDAISGGTLGTNYGFLF